MDLLKLKNTANVIGFTSNYQNLLRGDAMIRLNEQSVKDNIKS